MLDTNIKKEHMKELIGLKRLFLNHPSSALFMN